jgi:hypothetical protein
MFLALRPAEIWAHPEGQQVFSSLGIEEFVRQQLVRLSGTTPDNLEQAILSFSGRGAGQTPAISLVARAIKSVDEPTLKRNLGVEETIQLDGKTLFKGDGLTFYAPADGQNKLLVAVPMTDTKELSTWLAASKTAPVLPPRLELLARASDGQRHATLLAAPDFLFNEGRAAMVGTLGGLIEPAQNFLLDEAGQMPGAAMFSLHLSDSLFLELRTAGDSDSGATRLASLYRSRVSGLQLAVEQHISTLHVSPYSLKIMLRYPGFFGFINEHTRAGANGTQVVLRTVLPPMAASNLAFGTHLAMLESSAGGPAMPASPTTPQTPTMPQTLADRLKQNYTLTFDRDSLERTIDQISKDTGIPFRIEGSDLQLEGITKNQSFGLDEKDKPLFEILKTIMKKANPDGKLVYVFKNIDGQETVLITTRVAAAKRRDTIPSELR